MPQILKSARNGQIAVKEFYSTGEIAYLAVISHSRAARLIDSGEIRGLWLPTKRRQRRITHGALIAFVRRNPDFRYMLERLNGYDPRGDFPEGTEPPPPARPSGSAAPWSPEHPRSAKRGQIPQAAHYSAKEVAFLLGLAPDRHREVGRWGHPGDQGPRHGIDHLEVANISRGAGRLRAAEPALQLLAGPHPGLRVQQRFPVPHRSGPSPAGAPRRPRRARLAGAPAPDPPRRLQARS